jgi:hypothetical protein
MSRVADAVCAPLAVVRQLIEASHVDTVYRDLYLWRARAVLATTLPASEYGHLKAVQLEIDKALRQSRGAVVCGEWQRVRELAVVASGLKRSLDAKREEFALGAAIYEPGKIPLDPFLPGFDGLVGGLSRMAGVLERLRQTLEELQRVDPDWRGWYAGRRAYFQKFSGRLAARGQTAKTINPDTAALEALQMLEQGELDRLRDLADEIVRAPLAETATTARLEESRQDVDRELAAPLPHEVGVRARELGFAYVELQGVPEVAEYFRRNAWHPTFSDSERTVAGATRVSMGAAAEMQWLPEGIRELIALFAMHPYVNSGGARYLPRMRAQPALFEDFPEDAEPPLSPLLEALGLGRRRALSRLEIETALLERGADVLTEHLGLDPWRFRLLCIPFDVYVRVGEQRGWGRREQWTHFDGYQLMRNGELQALVGGDTRYGGLYDLVSIGADDQREQVIARFAVVRRERLLSRSL